MKDVHYNLKPNEMAFGRELNEELRSVDENFKELTQSIEDLSGLSLTEDEVTGINNANDLSGDNPVATIADIPFLEYNSFLTQQLVSTTSGELVVGKTYNIAEVLLTDDFSNVGYVEAGIDFVATGTTPTTWTNSTVVVNQTDSAPQALVLYDTIFGITYERVAAGSFNAISDGKFVEDMTNPYSAVGFDILGNKFTAEWIDVNTIRLHTYLADDLETLADGVFTKQEFNIRVRKS